MPHQRPDAVELQSISSDKHKGADFFGDVISVLGDELDDEDNDENGEDGQIDQIAPLTEELPIGNKFEGSA